MEGRKITAVFVHLVVLFFAMTFMVVADGHRCTCNGTTTPALGWKMGYIYLASYFWFFYVLFTIENLIETCVVPISELLKGDNHEEDGL